MSAPIHKMPKAEILKLAKGRCKHAHSYLSHYACYLDENPEKREKIGYLDIETSNLDADFGQILSWCILDDESGKIASDVFTPEDLKKGYEDKRITRSCVQEMCKYDKIVTYYGARFDIPYIRARALINGIEFPSYGTIVHKDLYFVIKSKFKLSSRRLENACRHLLGQTNKTRIDAKYWRNAVRGDKKSLKYILQHNEMDVVDLKKLYDKCITYSRVNQTSI